jgi:hypothetical protein
LKEEAMQTPIQLLALARPALAWCRARLASSKRPARSSLAALALAALALAPRPATAYPTRFEYAADGQLVDVQVRVEGRSAPLYFAPVRFDRRYFQAFRGRNYQLVLRNNTDRRVGVLIAVDGLNVVTGVRSNLSHDESMYVLDPHEQAVIRGWRTSLNDVRKFVFVDEERSYAERTGQANGDLGWIRVLAFREHLPWWRQDGRGQLRRGEIEPRIEDHEQPYGAVPERESEPRPGTESKAAPAPRQGGADQNLTRRTPSESGPEAERFDRSPDSNPGTGWGERRWDPVNRTWFQAERFATDQIVLRYEYANGLRALGIDPRWGRNRLWERDRGELGFAEPPRW